RRRSWDDGYVGKVECKYECAKGLIKPYLRYNRHLSRMGIKRVTHKLAYATRHPALDAGST
ncbi:hypothetical protein, partial [Pseudoalteromonas rubra]|uniref:hypothetical protein n=1 Tax=Pseudoalteromonas rubra TaxID=43658 RepID=UPI001BB212CD